MGFDYSQPYKYWNNRFEEQGQEYVAHRQLRNYDKQKEIIGNAVRPFLVKRSKTLDFGSGVGRFQDMLWRHSDEVYALDYVKGALGILKESWPQTETVCHGHLPLPFSTGTFDLIWTCTVLQHIVEQDYFEGTCRELYRIAAPGGNFLMVENVSDDAPHVKPRAALDYAEAIGFDPMHIEKISVDHKDSHWVIYGRKPIPACISNNSTCL